MPLHVLRCIPDNANVDINTSLSAIMRFEGELQSWNDARSFGFIESFQGGQEISFETRACAVVDVVPCLL